MKVTLAFHNSFTPPSKLVLHFSRHAFPSHRPYPHLRAPLRAASRQLATACVSSVDDKASKKRVVFLGTPQVAATTLSTLYSASLSPSSTFTLSGVVTQPPAPTGRKRILTPSPVQALATELSIDPILIPSSARDPDFLSVLSSLEPDLCITAAYGNFLPTSFLKIPRYGTLNIHPSLLPQFRGAAPVPRALESGVTQTGVSILYTVLKMDAGPIVTTRIRDLNGDELAPDLLEELFDAGTHALLDVLPNVWAGQVKMQEQNDDDVSHAPKLTKDEGRLTFVDNARYAHNKVRAFAGWPGTWADFTLTSPKSPSEPESVRLKINRTIVLREEGGMCFGIHDVIFDVDNNCLALTCGDGSKLGILEVQPPGKKAMDARSFWNGLRGKSLQRKHLPY